MIVIVGGVVFLIILAAAAYLFMSSSKKEDAPAPSPAEKLEEKLPPPEEQTPEQAKEVMQEKQKVVEEAAAPTPEPKEEVKKEPVPKDAESAQPKEIPGLVGHYTADSWKKKANRWEDLSGKGNHVTEIKGTLDVDDDEGVKFVFGDKNAGCRFPTKVFTKGRKYTFFHVARYGSESDRGRIFDGTDSNTLSGFWAGRQGVAHKQASGGHGWITHHEGKREGWIVSTDQKQLYRANGIQRSQGAVSLAKTQHTPKQMTLNFGQFTDAQKRGDQQVSLFKHCAFGGNRVTKTSGAYRLARISAQDNDISAVVVPAGMELTIFDRPDLKGASKTFTGPVKDACLVDDGWNDKLSSMLIKNTTGGGIGPESSKWQVAEILFYNRELSLDEIKKVETYLMKKYKQEVELLDSVWSFSSYNHDKTAGTALAHHGIGFHCGNEGVISQWRLHAHGGSGAPNGIGNHNFQYEGSCKQGGIQGGQIEKKTGYVDAGAAGAGSGVDAYKKLIDEVDCRGSPVAGFHFETSADKSKVRVHYVCNDKDVDENTCQDVTAVRHKKKHKDARLKSDGLLSAMHYQDLNCGAQVLTKMTLEDQDNGEIHLKGKCCSLEDI